MTDYDKRLQAVRDAFWNNTSEDDDDLYVFHDALADIGFDKPTSAQQKSLFMLIPEGILGQGIRWGFSDTEVRDAVHEFAKENEATVRAAASSAT